MDFTRCRLEIDGTPAALKAHGEGNLALAATHYQRALEQNQFKSVLFQNYGALLRGNGDLDQAKAIYCKGLELFPQNLGILRNYSNLLRERGETAGALQSALNALRIAWKDENSDSLELIYCECVDLLHHMGSLQWSVALLRQAFEHLGVTTRLLWALFCLSRDDRSHRLINPNQI